MLELDNAVPSSRAARAWRRPVRPPGPAGTAGHAFIKRFCSLSPNTDLDGLAQRLPELVLSFQPLLQALQEVSSLLRGHCAGLG